MLFLSWIPKKYTLLPLQGLSCCYILKNLIKAPDLGSIARDALHVPLFYGWLILSENILYLLRREDSSMKSILSMYTVGKKVILTVFLGITIAAGVVNAMPGAEKSFKKFESMDTNNDGSITPEEFFASNKDMKEGAFKALDTNNDNVINNEEWNSFVSSHARNNMGVHGGNSEQESVKSTTATAADEATTQAMPELLMPNNK